MARRLGPFLRATLTPERAVQMSRRGLARRNEAWLDTLDRALTPNALNPYSRLLHHAGIAMRDVREAVRQGGLEATLEMLYEHGVYVTAEEFKGRTPIRRGSLSIDVGSHDFDHPLARSDFETRTGGSRSTGTRLFIDLDLVEHDAAYVHHQCAMAGLYGRPLIVWCAAPPFQSGMNEMLRCAKLGITPRRWFAQSVPTLWGRSWRQALFTDYVLHVARTSGHPVPAPERLPLTEAGIVAEALAAAIRAGERPVLRSNASSAVRVCIAAEEQGLDVSGTTMRVSAEPYTPAKAAIVHGAGCTAMSWYATGEAGIIGLPCGNPAEVDEVHLMSDKIAMIRREQHVGPGQSLLVNVHSSLVANTPKLMLNVVSDDYAVLAPRACGCALEALGFETHLHTIRSWEKLTSEGMTFHGHDLIRLIEEILPARFGGSAATYQFVEHERGGLPKVDLMVSPRIGDIDEAAMREAVLAFLDRTEHAQTAWADRWRQGDTLSVIRGEPIATTASKVMALHVMRGKAERQAPP